MDKALFIVWKKYQRRSEVLAPKLMSEVVFMPHVFRRKALRPIDYLYKLFAGIYVNLRKKPPFVLAQSPPLYSAIPALVLGIPYVLDAHNPVFQNVGGKISWGKLPLSSYIIRKAAAVIVHNHGILKLARQAYPNIQFFNIPDPIERIAGDQNSRRDRQILVICSFDPDEPIEVLIETMRQLPEYTFVITADVMKLPSNFRTALQSLLNVQLTGFLPIQDYHQLLCNSLAALVLTNQDLIQPSGACEALSSDTQLLVSKTSLTSELFGEWAILVDNSPDSIVPAVRSLKLQQINLSQYRDRWNQSVDLEIQSLQTFLKRSSNQKSLTQNVSRT